MVSVADALRARKTEKILADPSSPLPATGDHRDRVDSLLAAAAWAPFHFPSDKQHHAQLQSPVPWRFYKCDTSTCRQLIVSLQQRQLPAAKILNMLAAADVLLQVTWLPDSAKQQSIPEGLAFEGTQRNMEHIAAAAAAVQSLLLLATEHGYRTYWSSGGVLRSAEIFELLGIPANEVSLGSVFLYPRDIADADVKPGRWREERGTVADWSAWCTVT